MRKKYKIYAISAATQFTVGIVLTLINTDEYWVGLLSMLSYFVVRDILEE